MLGLHNKPITHAFTPHNNKKLPMTDFTLQNLLDFTQKEEEMVKEFTPQNGTAEMEPCERSVKNLLAYSKALSIRKSSKLKTLTLVLN